jgi:hypothetical protein
LKPRNIILTGVPRSGTTLCCNLLGQAPDTVALFEPMPVHELPRQHAAAVGAIRDFFLASRASLLESGTATSQQVDGRVPDNPFGSNVDADGLRIRTAQLGDIQVEKALSGEFSLVIKHNAAFTALLPELVREFECYAVVRNPLAVLASWNSVNLPVTAGRLPAGERLSPELAARLDAEPDVLERQLHLLDWLFARFDHHLPGERILRYEQVVATGGQVLASATGVAVPLLPLRNRNASRLYDADACRRYAERLHRHDGPWRRFYGSEDVASALDVLQGGM